MNLDHIRPWIATSFAVFFLVVSVCLIGLAFVHLIEAFVTQELITGSIKAINDTFIALATFELGTGIFKEYKDEDSESNLYFSIRRIVARFVSVVIIALALEGLIMVIKYSQLELAGNLYYPVAVIVATSILLIALGLFLSMTRQDSLEHHSVTKSQFPEKNSESA